MMPRRWIAAALAVPLLAVLVLVGWRVLQVRGALLAVEDDGRDLSAALADADGARADRAQERLQSHARSAADGTSGPVWRAMGHLPFLGDDARAVALLSRGLERAASSAVPALRSVADQRDDLAPVDGRVPIERVSGLEAPLADADDVVQGVVDDLDGIDADRLIGPLRTPWRSAVDRMRSARDDLAAARTAVDLLPAMLGADGPRRYLLVFQNNAEVRATGGLPGSVALLDVDDGRAVLTRQVPGNIINTGRPVLPLTTAERRVYGVQLGTYFIDANWTPDFPRTAQLWTAHWQRRFPGEAIDGVVSIDPVALSYLLRATGPVTVGGIALTSENAVDELLSGVYNRLPDPSDQDRFFQEVAATLFARFTGGVEDPGELVRALAQGVAEHRIYLQSAMASEQARLAEYSIAGALPTGPTARPDVGVYLADATGSKMSYFLRTAVDVTPLSCVDDVQRLEVSVTLRSVLPPDGVSGLSDYVAGYYEQVGLQRGEQIVGVRLYAPIGGSVGTVALDQAEEKRARRVQDGDRQISSAFLVLEPGGSSTVTWVVDSGVDQTGDPLLHLTPGIAPSRTEVAPSGC